MKRFDIPPEKGGVNRIAPAKNWGRFIVEETQNVLSEYDDGKTEFVMFFPEAHILSAAEALGENSPIKLGCQSVYRQDTVQGGNFGAFTGSRTANSMAAIGCGYTIIGHCEERFDKSEVLAEAGVCDPDAVCRLLNKEIIAAQRAGLSVLYCIGEKAEERENWQEVLGRQLDIGLRGVSREKLCIAYEPVWSIGPGKTPPDADTITKIARFVNRHTGGLPLVYGGGLKKDNAAMLAAIPELSGGLIALTRFEGEIGFYPDEYLEIVRIYLGK